MFLIRMVQDSDCDKYQTGFDQPLLHTLCMWIRNIWVKLYKLSHVLTGTTGKEDPFVRFCE